ncbi:DUF4442 domain-containing protein [Actinokineospora sp. UTMC 2448]|uniref:DUF4442 domain-containing protein n=1 Tax=Actinokineospora sp. UTMC 2448 TaxID=2268449 RepID=UPI002164A90A|nr:DUF4442 domain-containing protein [Actinokineospora sp. UTMC 2448]UVS77384.1 putative thioesterase domain protein [Actinokineospora sp. UTMC 2448]
MTHRDAFNAALAHLVPQAHRMGVRAVELEPGRIACRVPLDGNGNHIGTMYAGVLFTVAEVLGGGICLPSFDLTRYYPVVRSVRIDFTKPARTDVVAEAALDGIEAIRTEVQAHGRADFTLNATLRDTAGIVVASTEGAYQLRAR